MHKNWKRFPWLIVLCVLLLSGCHHDQKQAETIYTDLEKAANLEKTFADHQQALNEADKEEQTIYQKVMDLDTDHIGQLKQHIETAQKNNKKQRELLDELDEDLDNAYELSLSIQSSIKKIRDTEQKRLAREVGELMEKRYELFGDYYEQYEDVLKENNQFYELLQKKDRDATALDNQIKKMNKRYSKMAKQQDEFNRCTEQYNEKKSKYYHAAGLAKHT